MKFIPASPLNSQSAKQQNSVARAIRIVDSGQVWGWFAVAATPHGVCAATFGHDNELEAGKSLEEITEMPAGASSEAERIVETAVRELRAFFAGESARFHAPIDVAGTAFQRAVWEETKALAYGTLASYQDIARRIGKPLAYRAVGNALGQNPLPVIVPCHRVIASDGSFGGYTRGLPWKERLLAHEGSLELVHVK